jgi:hypothetical protein
MAEGLDGDRGLVRGHVLVVAGLAQTVGVLEPRRLFCAWREWAEVGSRAALELRALVGAVVVVVGAAKALAEVLEEVAAGRR